MPDPSKPGMKRTVRGHHSTGPHTGLPGCWTKSPAREETEPPGEEGVDLLVANRVDRFREIVEYTRQQGRADVSDLAVQLGVASETVRRDLTALEQQGLVRRAHGVAFPVDNAGFETSLDYRSNHLVPEKRRIAAAAVDVIGPAS